MTKIFCLMKENVSPSLYVIIIIIIVVWYENMLGVKGFGMIKGNAPILLSEEFSNMKRMV